MRFSSANGEVQHAVGRSDDDVGDRQRSRRRKSLVAAPVTAAIGVQVDGVDVAIAPVADEQRILILLGEFGSVAETNPGWRSWSDIDRTAKRIGIVGRPLSGSVSPTELGSADHMIDSRRAIPRCSDIPFHIGVIGKQFAFAIERDVVLVPEPGCDQFHIARIRVDRKNESARSHPISIVPASIRHSTKQVIFAPVTRHSTAGDIRWQVGVVAGTHQDPFAIGRQNHGVRSMLAAAIEGQDVFFLVVLIIAVGIGQSPNPRDVRPPFFAARINVRIQRSKRAQQTLCSLEIDA